MLLPSTDDTIVAVSSGWTPSPIGIVRLSGPQSHDLIDALVEWREPLHPDSPRLFQARVAVDPLLTLPATIMLFHAPHSYTAQDMAEIHTIGCLPALRSLCATLIARGARRALPGDFTARAFLSGKLAADQVEAVLSLINAESAADARAAARLSLGMRRRCTDELMTRLKDLLALIEAGIDFVEEEDVSFVSPPQVCRAIEEMQAILSEWQATSARTVTIGKPHVALAGLPNSGKSTLFNALLGRGRAIVSPVIGTTRDVISAEIDVGAAIILQDTAGLSSMRDDLEAAAHRASENAAEQADLVLWVHDRGQPWDALEVRACRSIPIENRILVRSKLDIRRPPLTGEVEFRDIVDVSCVTGDGLDRLRSTISRRLELSSHERSTATDEHAMGEVRQSLTRALELAGANLWDLKSGELIALELRVAAEALSSGDIFELSNEVLGRVFSQFCVGK
ncbi:MAG: 50S ribosome-binding GTPase [Planctomycetes bacterium]|nr:50S ribosome-binding GTPase [Planctomycetota bacterium]